MIAINRSASALGRLRDLVILDGRENREIASAAGITPGHLSNFMTGKRSLSFTAAVSILVVIGRKLADLDGE